MKSSKVNPRKENKMLKTNLEMLKDLLDVYKPERRGIVSMTEIKLIVEKLHLHEMDEIQLRNLRDFTVAVLTTERDNMEEWDKMSAITAVIDDRLMYLRKEA